MAELKARHVGLVVLVNKYDGIDLPGKACELLILDGIPRPMDAWERREADALADSPGRLAREIQRIEQGMGRGVRDTEDHCAVLLLGANLGVATHDPRHLSLFSPATRAQLGLSRDIADQIQGRRPGRGPRGAARLPGRATRSGPSAAAGRWPRSATPTPASSGPRPSPPVRHSTSPPPARPGPLPTGCRTPSTTWRTQRPAAGSSSRKRPTCT